MSRACASCARAGGGRAPAGRALRAAAHPLPVIVPTIAFALLTAPGTLAAQATPAAPPPAAPSSAAPARSAATAPKAARPAFTTPAQAAAPAPVDARLLSGLRFREIGPAVTGGRIHDVEALPSDPSTLYVASATGGLWRSRNGGTTWAPLFQHEAVSTFGDVAVAPSDPDVVWAGTGEQNNRQSTSWGNGVYRSTDGGESWTHLGLEATRHIGRVVVHPEDPDVAWVAALGNLWRGTPDRGVYRTTDGGESWEKVLAGENPWTGAVELALDPRDPDVLYAATYQRLRRSWGFNGGGPGSGLWKSVDGGDRWTELREGLPEGDRGRIGLALSPADPDRLYALVEHAEKGGTYRSDDGGASWRRVNELNPRPMYYSHVVADPEDPDRVWVLATELYMSEDGGHTFRQMPTRPTYDVGVHSDHHTLWIDPANPRHLYLAGDAGLHVSFDRGETWRRLNNLPIGQFYGIGLDDARPYRIYGGMQDNHSWMGPSDSRRWIGIVAGDWKQIGFGDGMYQQPDPARPRWVYVGAQNGTLHRVDVETGDRLEIAPRPGTPLLAHGETPTPAEPTPADPVAAAAPAGAPTVADSTADAAPARGDTADTADTAEPEPYRYDWVTPSLASRHVDGTLYLGGNRFFVSRDHGTSWRATPDLTRAVDRDTLELMGVPGSEPMLSKHDGTASTSEIVTLAESPLDGDVLWVGTDDGLVQLSRDGGLTWNEVGGPVRTHRDLADLPDGSATLHVSRITPSAEAPGVAYLALDAHRRGDFRTLLFRTEDFGERWTPLHGGFPAGAGPVNDVVEHPDRAGLLFAGTEHGLFLSPDRGASWTRLEGGLPTTLFDDLAIHPRERDLVVATHGRGIWILDDTRFLAHWTADAAARPVHLLPSGEGVLTLPWKSTSYRGQGAWAGENPPEGVLLTYHLSGPSPGPSPNAAPSAAPSPADSVLLIIRNARGDTVRRLRGPGEAGVLHRVAWDLRHRAARLPEPEEEAEEEEREPQAEQQEAEAAEEEEEGAEEGVGRVVESERILPELPRSTEPRGPLVSPGLYRVSLVAGEREARVEVTVVADPLRDVPEPAWREREAFLLELRDRVEASARLAHRARELARTVADSAAVDSAGAGDRPGARAAEGGRGAARPAEPAKQEAAAPGEKAIRLAEELESLGRQLSGLASAYQGRGVTQGSTLGPTATHRRILRELSEVLEEHRRSLEALEEVEGDALSVERPRP